MRLFRGLTLAMIVSASILGCTKADTKPDHINGQDGKNEEGIATFLVKSLDGKGRWMPNPEGSYSAPGNPTLKTSWKYPREATFSFSACIQDRATRHEAVGHTFRVEIPGKGLNILDVSPTRPNGCFTWMETIPFTFFVKQSRWVVVERDIIGAGVHTGRQRVRLAVNPWALNGRDGREDVVYLRDEAMPAKVLVPPEQADAAFSGELFGPEQLFVDDVKIQTVRKGEANTGTFLRMNISMIPKAQALNAEGVYQYKAFEYGDFEVKAHLILTGAGDKMQDSVILTSGAEVGNPIGAKAKGQTIEEAVEIRGVGRIVDGKLVAHLDAWVDPRMRQGNLRLAMKVIPIGVRGLKEFGGVYELGALKSLSSGMDGQLVDECRNFDSGCDIKPHLEKAINYDQVRAKKLASDGSPYLFDRLRLRFVQVQPGETTTQRTVAYSASTCVIDAFTGDRVVGLKFKIQYHGDTRNPVPPPIEKATAEDGCLNWDSTIWHQYYQPEEFIPQVVTISKDTGVSRDLKFYINPWDDKFTFGFDEREFTDAFWNKLKERKKIKSRFFLGDFGYHTVRFQYNIDALMSLEVRKTVLMELQPQVLRYSGIINARKMTEPLRDGIWLLKVGIQKNYLDPATAGVVIDSLQNNQAMVRMETEPSGASQKRSSNRLRKLGIEAQSKEYISTETALVRVTDGMIIQPVELRMQDLRMMRIRANFLVQLEPVDERKLQTHNALHRGLQNEMEKLLDERQKKNNDLNKDGVTDDEKAEMAKRDRQVREKMDRRRDVSRRVFDYINRQLNANNAFPLSLDGFEMDAEQKEYIRHLFGLDTPTPTPGTLKKELETNDFTDIKLPACVDINCNDFVETNSGLDRRTFVGPVIFLSNGYKDSVRATDNLDEAKCGQKVEDDEADDALSIELKNREHEMFVDFNSKLERERPNTVYKYSEYFGSLRHLCFSHVDDLIRREKEDRFLYQRSGPAVASVYQFADSYKLDYLSLANEKPKKVDITPEAIQKTGGDLMSQMQETTDRWVSADTALDAVNTHLTTTDINSWGPRRWLSKNPDDVKLMPWDVSDLRSALFSKTSPRALGYAGCAVLARSFTEGIFKDVGSKTLSFNLLGLRTDLNSEMIEQNLISECVNHPDPLIVDRKLRVFRTGQDGDSYIFLGGLQVNLNIGQSFSVSRSDGYSWSWGFEPLDVIGYGGFAGGAVATAAKMGGTAFKPFNLKVGWGHSMGNSSGTSVSDSTYLVAQIASFKVRLEDYEQCMVLKLSPKFLHRLRYGSAWFRPLVERAEKVFSKTSGLLVCEGEHNSQPKYVKENYYYFTQHFTEGDMLDNADLYNHPWLLALRGQRDFGTFLGLIRSQEVVSFGNFVDGALGNVTRKVDWPLEQMLDSYKRVTPSFPGFYTELDPSEEMTQAPLERRMSKQDADINNEVISRDRRKDLPEPSR